jgi:hypothetical protein
MLYVSLRKYNTTTPRVEDDKWEALTRIASLLPESDIELQHVGGHAVVSRRLSDGSLQPWGVAPLLVGEPLPRGREWSPRFLPLLDQALTDAKSTLRREFDLSPRGTLLDDRARLALADARALQQGVPSTSLVRRVLCDVANELSCRRKKELEMEFASEGQGAFKDAVAALRVALESKDTVAVDPVDWCIVQETKVDEPLAEIPHPQPGHQDYARYPSAEVPHFEPPPEEPVDHAQQAPVESRSRRSNHGLPQEALWRLLDDNTSDATARQQGVPDLVNDESDFVPDYGSASDSDSSSEPAAEHAPVPASVLNADINDPRWAAMTSVGFGLGYKAMRAFSCADESADVVAQLMKLKLGGVPREDMERILSDVGAHIHTHAIPYTV